MTAESPKKNIRPALFLLMLCLALFVDITAHIHNRRRGVMVGKPVAAFDLPQLGKPGSRLSPKTWKGQVAIINVFASWCKPCRMEHPLLMNLSRTTQVPIYGIAWKDKDENIEKILESRGNPYTIVAMDREGNKINRAFSMRGIPETFVVDKNGIVAYHYISALDEDEINNTLLPTLQKLMAASPEEPSEEP